MKALTDPAKGATLILSRYNIEVMMQNSIVDLCVTLIPLAHSLIEGAIAAKVSANSPAFMAPFSLYFTINQCRNHILILVQELAKEEPRYKEVMGVLWVGQETATDSIGSINALDKLDVQLQQWRLNFQKFIKAIDPSSLALQIHHNFDADPPA